jgi:uncharacterized membrane protein
VSDAAAPRQPARPRIQVIDWLRGLAVVLMIQAHGFDAWLTLESRTGAAWSTIRHLSGIPSRLFLLLVGVSAAIKFESQIAKGVPSSVIRAETAKRGLLVLALAYVFRLQEWILAAFWGGWEALFRVDILNCIGASLLVLALVSVPRSGRPRVLASLAAAAVFVAFGPLIGPAQFPTWLPRPLTSYLGGQRPMAWFTLFPWAAWALTGVAVGHVWIRGSRTPRGQAITFLVTGAVGLAMTGAVILIREVAPEIIRYPSEMVQQMGPGSFFYRLGLIGGIAALGWMVTRVLPARFSPMRQLGQTSLLVYWVHIEFCYGHLADPLKRKLSIPQATAWILALTLAMLGLSVVKTRHGGAIGRWVAARGRALVPRRTARVRAGVDGE